MVKTSRLSLSWNARVWGY